LLDGRLAEPTHFLHNTASKKASPTDLSCGAC
jgi:hypothetical protein